MPRYAKAGGRMAAGGGEKETWESPEKQEKEKPFDAKGRMSLLYHMGKRGERKGAQSQEARRESLPKLDYPG